MRNRSVVAEDEKNPSLGPKSVLIKFSSFIWNWLPTDGKQPLPNYKYRYIINLFLFTNLGVSMLMIMPEVRKQRINKTEYSAVILWFLSGFFSIYSNQPKMK